MTRLTPVVRDDCGTYAGANTHTRRGERLCDDCTEAKRRYVREWRRKNASLTSAVTYPLVLDPRLAGLPLVGLTVARSVRESA